MHGRQSSHRSKKTKSGPSPSHKVNQSKTVPVPSNHMAKPKHNPAKPSPTSPSHTIAQEKYGFLVNSNNPPVPTQGISTQDENKVRQ